MKISDLKKELKNYPDDMEIKIRYTTPPDCQCNRYREYRCYCPYEEHTTDFSVSKVTNYEDKFKKQKIESLEFVAH